MLGGVQVVLLGFVLVASVRCQVLTSCASPVTVILESQLNETGQWTAKVGLEHQKQAGPWMVKTDVCEEGGIVRVVATLSAGTGGVTRAAPTDYIHFPGVGYFKFHPNGTNWPTARLICSQEVAHLAIINSEAEADVMALLFARYPKPMINAAGNDDWAWVGAHEMGTDGEFYTIFGQPLASTGFIRWVSGQGADKDVDGAVVTYRRSGGLGDAYPSWNASFICEW